MAPKLFLFDIDLTLIDTGKASSRAFALAFQEIYGVADALAGISFPGRTDSSILAEVFSRHGIDQPGYPGAMAPFKETYYRFLKDTLANHDGGRILPGVDRLLPLLSQRPGIELGLSTGNFHRSAFIKLEHYGLAAYFADGGFGDDSANRNEVVAVAIRRAEKRLDHRFLAQDIYVVGDTPHDITSGQANGVATIGVATGRSSLEELAAYHPTHVFPDLVDAQGFLETVL